MHQDTKLKNHNACSCGHHFLRAGLWYFIFGIIIGFGVLIHYLVGSEYDNTQNFLMNITLWFGSPLSLSSAYIQLGGLGMAIIGAASCFIHHHYHGDVDVCSKKERLSLTLCHIGLIALFITGYIGYFVIDHMWNGFYYAPIPAGKNLWLILQGLSILVYVIGMIIATCSLCKDKKEHLERDFDRDRLNQDRLDRQKNINE